MKRFTFGSFQVDDANRQSFELCNDVAELRPLTGAPLVLLGDKGCGKTHLLYAIVNRVRSASADTGIAYVSPGDFPEQVKALLRDSSPLDKVAHAILLVDHLDRFHAEQRTLEQVIRLFLDRRERVVIATNVHPKRLSHLSLGLQALLAEARVVSIQAQDFRGRVETLETRIREEGDALVKQQREEIEALEAKIKALSESSVNTLRDELKSRKLERDLRDLQAELGETRTNADRLGEELRRIHSERETLSAQAQEAAALRNRVRALEDDLAAARADAESHAKDSEEVARLRRALEEAQQDSETARLEADGLLSRAEALLNELQRGRQRFADAQREHDKQLKEIRELEALLAGESFGVPGEAIAAPGDVNELLQRQQEFDADRERERETHREALARLEAERDALKKERDAALEAFEAFRQEAENAQGKFDEVREMVEATNNELGRLRSSVEEAREDSDAWAKHAREAETERDLLRQDLDDAIEERKAVEATVERMREEQSVLRDALDEAKFESRVAQLELRTALDALERQKAGLEALRNEAMQQVAETRDDADSWRKRFEEAVGQLETRNTLRTGLSGGLKRLHDELGGALDSVGSLLERIEAANIERLRAAEAEEEGSDTDSAPDAPAEDKEESANDSRPSPIESGEANHDAKSSDGGSNGNGHSVEKPHETFEPLRVQELPRVNSEDRARHDRAPSERHDPATFDMPSKPSRPESGLHHVEDFEDDIDLMGHDEHTSEEPVHHRYSEYDDDPSI